MRRAEVQEEDYGQDSFLDVVANVVGVLIILVMVVGAAASSGLLHTTKIASEGDSDVGKPTAGLADKPLPNQQDLQEQVEAAARKASYQLSELRDTTAKIVNIAHQAQREDQLRLELAAVRSQVEDEIERRKSVLSAEDQGKLTTQNAIFQAKLELDDLAKEQIRLISDPGEVEEIDVQPTPVPHAFEEQPLHLRLTGGTVCRVPVYELLEAREYEMASLQREYASHGRVNRTFGPIDGFRMKMTTYARSDQGPVNGPLAGKIQRGNRTEQAFLYHPVSEDFGISIDQAMLPSSRFRRMLKANRKQTSVAVVWVYEDSFDDYRPLRVMLSEEGYSIAVRNLSKGDDIGVATDGTKSRAQ